MSAGSNLLSYRVPESVIEDRYLLTVDEISYTPEVDAETGDNRRKFCCASDNEIEKTLIDNDWHWVCCSEQLHH